MAIPEATENVEVAVARIALETATADPAFIEVKTETPVSVVAVASSSIENVETPEPEVAFEATEFQVEVSSPEVVVGQTAVAEDVSAVVVETVKPLETIELPIAQPEVVAPTLSIEKALETSGLVMVETSSDKAKALQPEVVVPETTPRPRRKRVAPVATQNEPLMMVETRSKD